MYFRMSGELSYISDHSNRMYNYWAQVKHVYHNCIEKEGRTLNVITYNININTSCTATSLPQTLNCILPLFCSHNNLEQFVLRQYGVVSISVENKHVNEQEVLATLYTELNVQLNCVHKWSNAIAQQCLLLCDNIELRVWNNECKLYLQLQCVWIIL